MPQLLRHLGFEVNERAHRARCLICGAHNPTTFSWREDGRWHCFRCGAGGNKYALVRAVTGRSFPEAVALMADLAGLSGADSIDWCGPTAQEKRQCRRLEEVAEKYHTLETLTRFDLAGRLSALERLRDLASERLGQLHAGAPERFLREEQLAWSALAMAYQDGPAILAAYYLVSFASEESRQRFILYPAQRERLIESCLLHGGMVGDFGEFVELPL